MSTHTELQSWNTLDCQWWRHVRCSQSAAYEVCIVSQEVGKDIGVVCLGAPAAVPPGLQCLQARHLATGCAPARDRPCRDRPQGEIASLSLVKPSPFSFVVSIWWASSLHKAPAACLSAAEDYPKSDTPAREGFCKLGAPAHLRLACIGEYAS